MRAYVSEYGDHASSAGKNLHRLKAGSTQHCVHHSHCRLIPTVSNVTSIFMASHLIQYLSFTRRIIFLSYYKSHRTLKIALKN